MDLIEPGFRALYEGICTGNKAVEAEHVFFELMRLEEGLGTARLLPSLLEFGLTLYVQVVISRGTAKPTGATPTMFANPSVRLPSGISLVSEIRNDANAQPRPTARSCSTS